jgi:hypothetical protein
MRILFLQSKFILIAGALLVASGCGRIDPPNGLYAPSLESGTFSYTVGNSDANFSCPTQPNVLEEYDDDLRDTGKFTVCSSRTSAFSIRVHGRTKSSDSICVFPAQYIDQTRIVAKVDSRGYPIVTCASASDIPAGGTGLVFEFANTNFNAVFIVERPYRDQMQMCLFSNNPYACPEYSYGKFR